MNVSSHDNQIHRFIIIVVVGGRVFAAETFKLGDMKKTRFTETLIAGILNQQEQ